MSAPAGLVVAVRELRKRLTAIDDAISEAGEWLDRVEDEIGIVREDGSSEADVVRDLAHANLRCIDLRGAKMED